MTHVLRQDNGPDVRRVTWIGLAWNVALTAGKFLAGIFGGSNALVADAVHSASDFATDVVILAGSRYWNTPPDEEHPYGHRRFETLVTIFIGVAIVAVGIGLGWSAIRNLLLGHIQTRPEPIAAVMALASVVVKEILYRYTRRTGERLRSPSLVANAWHHRSDAFSSVPVLFALLLVLPFPELWYADAVGAALVSVLIAWSGLQIAWPGLHQVVDRCASPEITEKLKKTALAHPAVISLHDFRTRYVGSDLHVDLHIVVDAGMSLRDAHDVAEDVERRLIDAGENVVDALVHIDPFDPEKAQKR